MAEDTNNAEIPDGEVAPTEDIQEQDVSAKSNSNGDTPRPENTENANSDGLEKEADADEKIANAGNERVTGDGENVIAVNGDGEAVTGDGESVTDGEAKPSATGDVTGDDENVTGDPTVTNDVSENGPDVAGDGENVTSADATAVAESKKESVEEDKEEKEKIDGDISEEVQEQVTDGGEPQMLEEKLPVTEEGDGKEPTQLEASGGNTTIEEDGATAQDKTGIITPSEQSDQSRIDGVEVLHDILEEDEEEKEELLKQMKEVLEERERLLDRNYELQHEVAEYLARKKDDEKSDPGRTIVDHEKRYNFIMCSMETLQGERDKMKKQYQIQEAEMIALRDQKLEEVKRARAEFAAYKKEKIVNAVDNRTGKRITSADADDFQEQEDKKEAELVKVRLESIKLQNKIAKLENLIRKKEQLSGGVHMIDFEQLKINNVDLNEKIEEKNDDILKLRKKVTSTVQVLTHVKEKLQFLQAENAEKKATLREIEAIVAKKRDILTHIKQTRDSLRADNIRLRQKGGLVGHKALLRDYEETQDESEALMAKLERLQRRHAELSVMCEGLKKKIEQAKFVNTQGAF